ncbi:gem-associated protein 2-like [Argiope bruennichi]|uniref:Gem-associated protein 2 like protein n=1 Tax=Argiope bruennichi TaxID=94029 RepID=A0A8T0FM13_ARGBR|nr:gem-associated protein 2-like [Argiope bruennichi]KAF8791268.1 Gem-associated protein 2 like protein [Argiope bruennichi]
MAGQVFQLPDFDFFDWDDDDFVASPRDGNPGIRVYIVPTRPVAVDEHTRNRANAIYASIEFVHLYCEIKQDRDFLIEVFPQEVEFPEVGPNSKLEWCNFCLGSRLCTRIYNEGYEEPGRAMAGHSPLLSIVVHLDQDALFMLLKYLHEWFLSIGMEDSLGGWLYAVLACIRLPLAEGVGAAIATLYNDCEERLKFCNDPSERKRLYQFCAIFDVHFHNHLN